MFRRKNQQPSKDVLEIATAYDEALARAISNNAEQDPVDVAVQEAIAKAALRRIGQLPVSEVLKLVAAYADPDTIAEVLKSGPLKRFEELSAIQQWIESSAETTRKLRQLNLNDIPESAEVAFYLYDPRQFGSEDGEITQRNYPTDMCLYYLRTMKQENGFMVVENSTYKRNGYKLHRDFESTRPVIQITGKDPGAFGTPDGVLRQGSYFCFRKGDNSWETPQSNNGFQSYRLVVGDVCIDDISMLNYKA